MTTSLVDAERPFLVASAVEAAPRLAPLDWMRGLVMILMAIDHRLVQWLHVSKYPPCIAYVALELGIMCPCLAVLFEVRTRYPAFWGGLLLLLGQTPMFFYVLHFPVLATTADRLGVAQRLGIWSAYFGAAAVIAVLSPACLWYRSYKARHKDGWPRYI